MRSFREKNATKMVDIIIPCGGEGSAFKAAGYTVPKPMVNILGKPMLLWVIDSLDLKYVRALVVAVTDELLEREIASTLYNKYHHQVDLRIFCITGISRGPLESIVQATDELKSYDPLPFITLDSDSFYLKNILEVYCQEHYYENAVFVTDVSNEPADNWCFLKFDNNMRLTDIKEKVRISEWGGTGAYAFSSLEKFLDIAYDIEKSGGLLYNSEVFARMLAKNERSMYVLAIPLERPLVHTVDNPIQLRLFCEEAVKPGKMTNLKPASLRFAFDLDGTLFQGAYNVHNDEVNERKFNNPKEATKDYFSSHSNYDHLEVRPIQANVDVLKQLKSMGHTIVITTSRRMQSNYGNVGAATADIAESTIALLKEFEIPYDELHFGIPYADAYIGDRYVCSHDDLNKRLGIYAQSAVDPRSFHSVQSNVVETITKKSNSEMGLVGEIHWYNNVPKSVTKYFPTMYNWDKDQYKWYTMERVAGIPATKLLSSEQLTPSTIENILSALNEVHTAEPREVFAEESMNIYENYARKLTSRYNTYDYSVFEGSEKIYEYLRKKLVEYEEQKQGVVGNIHGDPVLSNIIISGAGSIKLIDMRGKLGEVTTTFGDVYYDYAKVYQSLTGYSYILCGAHCSSKFRRRMLDTYESFAIKRGLDMTNIKIIAASLYFSLIPLHDGSDKVHAFFTQARRLLEEFI